MTNKALALAAARARRLGMEMVFRAGSGHIGGSLSSADILTELYFEQMHIDPAEPHAPWRDRFVMSKGHCTPALYSVLSLRGYFPQEELSTGSLGQGISAAVGMALAGQLDRAGYRVYALLGDGEVEEGEVWEAAMCAAKYRLDNLCAIVDVNGLQIDGRTADVMPSEPLDEKFAAFNWHVVKADGHNFDSLRAAFEEARAFSGAPSVILARTVKGKGVSFMENDPGWHGKAPNAEQYERAMAELDSAVERLEVL